MELIEEIREIINGIDYGYIPIEAVGAEKAWVFRDMESTGVMIPYDGEVVNEEFSSVLFASREVSFASGTIYGLALSCFSRESLWEFASVCANFVEPGFEGCYRREITKRPIDWWKRWKSLIGNSVVEPMVYSVLGELVSFYYLLKTNKKVIWRGPSRGTHDFTYEESEYEVKSTVSRNTNEITGSSEYQFQPSENKLKLLVCVFEEADFGFSIDEMVKRLGVIGADVDDINHKLLSLGYKNGRTIRKKKYKLLSFDLYPVDEEFPYVDMRSIEDTGKGRIKNLSYSIDIAGLKHFNLLNEI